MSPERLKGRIRNLSKSRHLDPNQLMEMYFFERILERLSNSRYRRNFIIKGGFLISSLIGIYNRTTHDLDTTIKGIPVSEDSIRHIITEILNSECDDGIRFELSGISRIREIDEYEDFRVRLIAIYGKTRHIMKIDITVGDEIVPSEIDYPYHCIFDDKDINVCTYTMETVIAEKFESILSWNIVNTRIRDFYDIFSLWNLLPVGYDYAVLLKAIETTSKRRGSLALLCDSRTIVNDIRNSDELKKQWLSYAHENTYVGNISFEDTCMVLDVIASKLVLWI